MTVDRPMSYDEVYGKLPAAHNDLEVRSNCAPEVATLAPVVQAAPGSVWEPPSPFGPVVTLTRFPTETLPGWAYEFVEAEAEATQTPTDLAGVLALTALATAAGGRAVVEARPGWREPLNLFAAVAMPPGARKTPVFAAITAPLGAAERDALEGARAEVIEAEARRKAADAAADQAQNVAGKASDDVRDAKIQEAKEARLMAEAITVPNMPRLLADDATPEALTSLLAEQGGRIAVLADEGDIFDVMAGRYSKTSSPNLAVYLKGHAGSPMRVDRKGRPPEHIESPALTLGLAVQPEVLRAIADRPGFRGRGLLARFLWALPESNVGRRKVGATAVPDNVAAEYGKQLAALVRSLAEWTDPAVIPMTDDANRLLLDFETELEPQLGASGNLGHVADWASKLAGHAVRLAGLLHLAHNVSTGWGRPLTADSMRDGITLARYFINHALAAFDLMGADPDIEHARTLADWCRTRDEFTRRDAHRDHQARFPKATDLDPVLALLEAHGYIRRRRDDDTRNSGGRPPSPTFDVNPRWC